MGWPYVIAGYAIVAVVVVLYAAWMIVRGRSISAEVPEERRRFLD
jgi:hypothetical protein